jgi:hypothetical protein
MEKKENGMSNLRIETPAIRVEMKINSTNEWICMKPTADAHSLWVIKEKEWIEILIFQNDIWITSQTRKDDLLSRIAGVVWKLCHQRGAPFENKSVLRKRAARNTAPAAMWCGLN